MKLKLVLCVSLVCMSLLLLACGANPDEVTVEATYDDFMEVQDTISRVVTKDIEVPVGSSFTVTLWSNQTTGFKWTESATIKDSDIILQTDHTFVPPEDSGLAGAAGKEVWTFKALKKGTSDISMKYSQPWEGGEKDAFSFFLFVTVK
ncbi:protease inhibitor I42 family protein [Chloroflexota bacterium]